MSDDKRTLERLQHRLTFDCMNAKVTRDGKRVYCIKGHKLSGAKDGTMSLIDVETGKVAEACITCWKFVDGRD